MLSRGIQAEQFVTNFETAEMVKYTNNAWHAVKITFANEIGGISKALGIDSHEVMRVLVADRKLNISPAYMKPGFVFGGSCLPKDLRALRYRAASLDVGIPMLEATLQSNQLQIERAFRMVQQLGHRNVGLIGLAFKSGTDDLRESALVELAERLLGKGFDLRIFDSNVNLPALSGSNQRFAAARLPHLSRLLVGSIDQIMDHSQTIIVGSVDDRFRKIQDAARTDQHIIDLARLPIDRSRAVNYAGIGW